jgi:hypothetical protein
VIAAGFQVAVAEFTPLPSPQSPREICRLTCTDPPSAQPTPHSNPTSSTTFTQRAHRPPTNALAITDDSHRLALLSTPTFSEDSSAPRRQLDDGVPLQLTVAAGPDPSVAAWVPSESLLLSGPGGCWPRRGLPGGASSRYRAVGRGRRGRPCQQASHGRRASVSSRRCPPIRFRRPGSGCPAVRCPVTWGRRPERPAVGRLLSTRPASSRLLSIPCGVQPSGVRPRPSGRVRILPPQAVALGTQVEEAETRATLPTSGWSGGGRWRTRAAGLGGGRGGRACPLSDQAGQAGAPSAPRRRLRGGHGSRLQREVAAPATWLASSGWGRDHGEWS